MKHYLIIILTTIPFILLSGCSKEDELLNNRNANNEDSTSSNTSKEEHNNDTPEKEENIYYVKYEVYMKDASSAPITREIKFTSEKGEQVITTYNDNWTGIYGPFKKGAKLSLTAKGSLVANTVESYIIISVSRNNEPFSVKGEKREKGGDLLSVSYTISY